MGYAPDWMRQPYQKVKHLADGSASLPDIPEPEDDSRFHGGMGGSTLPDGRTSIGGNGAYELDNGDKLTIGGGVSGFSGRDENRQKVSDLSGGYRVGYAKNLGKDRELDIGTTGYRYSGERGGEKYSGGKDFNSIDVRYRDKGDEYGIGYDPSAKRVQLTIRKRF